MVFAKSATVGARHPFYHPQPFANSCEKSQQLVQRVAEVGTRENTTVDAKGTTVGTKNMRRFARGVLRLAQNRVTLTQRVPEVGAKKTHNSWREKNAMVFAKSATVGVRHPFYHS